MVTVDAYRPFVHANQLDEPIADRLALLNVDDANRLRATSTALQELVRRAPLPADARAAILGALSVTPPPPVWFGYFAAATACHLALAQVVNRSVLGRAEAPAAREPVPETLCPLARVALRASATL